LLQTEKRSLNEKNGLAATDAPDLYAFSPLVARVDIVSRGNRSHSSFARFEVRAASLSLGVQTFQSVPSLSHS